jgi:hypothetical protein
MNQALYAHMNNKRKMKKKSKKRLKKKKKETDLGAQTSLQLH